MLSLAWRMGWASCLLGAWKSGVPVTVEEPSMAAALVPG